MTIEYNDTLANARLDAVVSAMGSGGKLVIGTPALSGATGVLITITFGGTFGVSASRVLTVSGLPLTVSPSANGTATKAELRTSGGTVIASGLTVGVSGSGADIIMDTISIVTTRTVTLVSATITHP